MSPPIRQSLVRSDSGEVRALQPWAGNTKKRLIKSPKVYIRDSGLLHALLDIETMEQFAHPVYGTSYDGFVIGLVLEQAGRRVAIEIKASTSSKLGKGNWSALETLQPDHRYVVAPVDVVYPLSSDVMVMPLDAQVIISSRNFSKMAAQWLRE